MLDVETSLSPTSREHRRGSEVEVVSTARLADGTSAPGEVVWQCTNTFVFFHTTQPCAASPGEGGRKASSAAASPGEGESKGEMSMDLPEPVLRETLSFEANLGALVAGLWCVFLVRAPAHFWCAALLARAHSGSRG